MKKLIAAYDKEMGTGKTIKDVFGQADKVRKFPKNTCPLTRHIDQAGRYLVTEGVYHLINEDPVYMGVSLVRAATLIWQQRDEINKLKKASK